VSTDPDHRPPVGPADLRAFAGSFATGVIVLTTTDGNGQDYGLTMNAVTCVCLDPPLFLACVDKDSATLTALIESGVFALNILARDQDDVSTVFARKGNDKFADLAVARGSLGVPLIEGGLAAAEFRVRETHEAGDHVIVIGEAVSTRIADGAPLLYFRSRYGGLHD
jgi:3-hydroxy-9,10-secoandrosta-1,3,5(10)-triene-9,17-dione monooxygenase reductase component